MDILNTLKFEIACPTAFECFENFLSFFCQKFSELKEFKEDIKEEGLKILEAAMLNFRFTFEMKPTQLALVVLKLAITLAEEKLEKSLFTDKLKEECLKYTEYSKGRMTGIEK